MHFTFHICIRFDILIGTETKQLIGLDYVKKLQVQQNQKDSKSWFCECKPSHILSTTPPAASKAVIGDKIKACQQCQHLKASSLTLGSLCIGWVMTGTRRCLDNNATFKSRLVKEEKARLFHLHVTFHCPSFNGIYKIAPTSCFTFVINQEYISNYLLVYSFG